MTVPIERVSFASASADEAWDALSRMYTRARPHTSSPEAALSVESVETPDIAVDRVWLHAAEGAFSESPDQVNVISVLSGRISLDFGRHGAVANVPDDSYLYLPDSPADLEWDTFSALAVRVPLARVARSAAELTSPGPGALRFLSMRPISAAHSRLWLRTATYLWRTLSDPDDVAGEALVHRELVNQAAATALSMFPNTAMTSDYVPGPGYARPAAVRRALEFIDANAHHDIDMTQIADAVGLDPRELQAAFRRHLDQTPLEYLRQARMGGAHRELHAADPMSGDTVAAIAARWGFTHLERFEVEYRRVHGCSPDATLRA